MWNFYLDLLFSFEKLDFCCIDLLVFHSPPVAKSSKSNLDADEIHHLNASSKEPKKVDHQQKSKSNTSGSNPNSDSKQTHASTKLDAAIKLRDQLAKILGIDPKRSGQRPPRAAANTNSLPKSFGADKFLFAGSRKAHANASEQSNQSAENKAEFEFANKLRSLVRDFRSRLLEPRPHPKNICAKNLLRNTQQLL